MRRSTLNEAIHRSAHRQATAVLVGLAAAVFSACQPVPVVPRDPAPPVTRSTVTPPTTISARPSCASSPAGCVSGWTVRTQTCLSAPPTSAADYQRAFDDRRVWGGGDVGKTVTLPDGRTLWLFGDTLTKLTASGGMAGPMLRNSIVVQKGACFSFVHAGTASAPTTPLPTSVPGAWFWPTAATVDPTADALHIVGVRVVDDPGAALFGWRVAGADVVTLGASDLRLRSVRPAPVPQDGNVTWNGSALNAGGFTYLYAFVHDHQIVARTTPSTIATHPWEFFDGSGWTTDIARARQPRIESAPAAYFTVVPHAGGYLASAKRAEMTSDDVSVWFASSPVGPWSFRGKVAHTAGAGSPYITYAGQVVPLPGAGLVALWSQNDVTANPAFDFRDYGPKFTAPATGPIP